MFRLAASRIAPRAPLAAHAQRQLTTSPALWVRIRSSNPTASGNGNGNTPPKPTPASTPASPSPSPAERPPAPPAETSPSKPFEPQVSSPAAAAPRLDPSGPSGGAPIESESPIQTPLEQPSPSSSTFATASDAVDPNINAKPDFSSLPSLDIDPDVALPEPKAEGEAGEGEKKRTGAREREYVSSMERQRRAYIRFFLGATLVGGAYGLYHLGQDDGKGTAEGVKQSWWDRVTGNAAEMTDMFSKPAFTKLLPDPLPAPHQKPYTLLVDLDGMLVSSTWDRAHGWRTVKRPGVDYFLGYLSQFYEIVLFTSQPTYTAIPVAEKLDPFGAYIPYKLFRDSTRTHQGQVVKDLSYLNRDLSKVVCLNMDPTHGALQPDNALTLPVWDGKPGDRGLVDMIPFLESIAHYNLKDVRPIITAYHDKDIPKMFAEREAEEKKKIMEQWERSGRAGGGAGAGFFSGIIGQASPNAQPRSNQPMTFIETKRAAAQKTYEAEQKYWKDNEEEFKRLMEEDRARQLAEMKGSLMGYFGGGGGPKKEA